MIEAKHHLSQARAAQPLARSASDNGAISDPGISLVEVRRALMVPDMPYAVSAAGRQR
ncbi:hypothetical protein [Roseovarius sp. D0-M9]|uniref:hypothetical protein n=1 Tax=Roseovarius sp. D0-M9 TaxID=3127117 RepID=UPI00300FB332